MGDGQSESGVFLNPDNICSHIGDFSETYNGSNFIGSFPYTDNWKLLCLIYQSLITGKGQQET